MHASRKKKLVVIHALSAAVLAAGFISAGRAQQGFVQIQQDRMIAPPVPAAQPVPDVGNTGKPDDPAGPLNREPGDLMSSGALVYVDDSFGSVDKLRTAIRSANSGQANLAIKQFQEITDQYGQKLVLLNDSSYVSITDFVRERLLAMPAVKNGLYDQIYGSDAKRNIDAAIENRDVAGLIRICDRYYPSIAALTGLSQAAEWYFERGEFTAAAQTWRKLLTHPLVGERKAQLLFNAATAETLARNGAGAQGLRERLNKDYADSTGTVSGVQVKLLSKLDEIMKLPAWEKTDLSGDEWPAFEGGPSRSKLLKTTASIGARLWGMPIANNLGLSQPVSGTTGTRVGAVAVSDPGMLTSHPVLSGGIIFVHSGAQVVALSANAGAKLWAYPADPGGDQQTRQFIQNTGMRQVAHDSASVFGDQVFAVLPAGTLNRAGNISYSGSIPVMAMRVVCMNRDDGTQIWSRSAAEIKLEKEGALAFVGSPVVTRQGVFVMGRKTDNANFSQQYLVRLDRETGEPTWSCYLCSTNNQISGNGLVAVPVPTLVDDILYISTGQGADCAVDANAGRILWLRPTITQQAASTGGARVGRTIYVPIQGPSRSWMYNAPMVIGDTLLTTDTGQYLRLYNRWTGQLLKAIPASELSRNAESVGTIDVLAGTLGSKVIMSLRNIAVCYELESLLGKTPQPEWTATVPSDAGQPMGRPFLSEGGYYVPYTGKLVRIDLRSGKAEPWDWPKDEQDRNGRPGNLLVTSEQVIVVNDSEVAGYSKWETARDNRLATIKANPRDPEPYLALAEISFRTNHQDLAQENMKKSVDLANMGATPGTQSLGEFLTRLYRTNLAFAEQLVAKDDAALWEATRFFYQQSHAVARQPEQQAEWRMRLAELSRREKKFEEAVQLYTEVLTDPALRTAGYHDGEFNQSAGSTAEMKIRDAIRDGGVAVFKREEDEASALTQRAIAAKDAAALQKVVDGYPNSAASLKAATAVAGLYQNNQNLEAARQVLSWLAPRLAGNPQEQARTYANLATVCVGLKRFKTAGSWASRGLGAYKDFTWMENGKKISFLDLKQQISLLYGADIDGHLPMLHASPSAPEFESAEDGYLNRKNRELISFVGSIEGQQLLSPVEMNPTERQANLLFVRMGDQLSILDAAKAMSSVAKVPLGRNADTVLMGATKEAAVLLQNDRIIGVDLKTFAPWTVMMKNNVPAPPAGGGGRNGPLVRGGRQVMVRAGSTVTYQGNIVIVDGNAYNIDTVMLIDENGNPYSPPPSASDPEAIRRAAFATLGQPRFTTARMFNGKLFVLAGNEINAYDVKTGKPAWTAPGGAPLAALLPPGTATCFVGNEDMIVAQVDVEGGKNSIFCAFDAESGKPRKTLKLEGERAEWRALGDDGTLYVVTATSTAAYDMVTDMNHAVWRKTDLGSRFAGADALTLDGLIVVSDEHEVQCLSLESGETRWKAGLKLELLASGAAATLRSSVQGDLIIFQSSDGSAGYKTPIQPNPGAEDVQLAWNVRSNNETLARQSLQVSDSLSIELLQGMLPSKPNSATSGAKVALIDRKGGKLYTSQQIVAGGFTVRNWQVFDGGIAFELVPQGTGQAGNVAGKTYLWKTTAPAH